MDSGHQYRADIDGLRAIAVLAVVMFHAFPEWMQGGFVGVDVFFVISGYLITSILTSQLHTHSFSITAFYGRRIRRLFPALMLVLMTSLVLGWFLMVPNFYQQLGKHIAANAMFVSNIVLWNEAGYFDNTSIQKPLLHLWSLAVEEQFYIIWPWVLWCAWKWGWKLQPVCLAVIIVSFTTGLVQLSRDETAAFYLPFARAWELALGAFIACRKAPLLYHRLPAGLGMLLIGGAAIFPIPQHQFPGWWALMPTLGTLLIISASPNSSTHRILAHPSLVQLGRISYPIYLWHWMLLSFASTYAGTLTFMQHSGLIVFSILLALATYQWVETPLRHNNRQRLKTLWLCALMGVTGTAGYMVYYYDGFKYRFPNLIIQDIVAYKFDLHRYWQMDRCFLDENARPPYFITCNTHPPLSLHKIVLWGDSQAASLYTGFEAELPSHHALLQLTARACPPIVNTDIRENKLCKTLNSHILERIKLEKPDRVVLAAAWNRYQWQGVDQTVRALKALGIKRIDIVGDLPQWHTTLPQTLYNYHLANPRQAIPFRLGKGFVTTFDAQEQEMEAYAKKVNVGYFSTTNTLCNHEGCITRLSNAAHSIAAWDSIHPTPAASSYIATRFFKSYTP